MAGIARTTQLLRKRLAVASAGAVLQHLADGELRERVGTCTVSLAPSNLSNATSAAGICPSSIQCLALLVSKPRESILGGLLISACAGRGAQLEIESQLQPRCWSEPESGRMPTAGRTERLFYNG